MESATFFTPPATASAIFCFPSLQNIHEGPEHEENINTLSMNEETFNQLHTETTTAVATSK